LIIKPQFDQCANFKSGVARVDIYSFLSKKIGYIKSDGSYIWQPSN